MLVAAALCAICAFAQSKSTVPPCAIYGQFVRQIDDLDRPVSIALAADGRLAVVEADAADVRVFGRDGKETLRLGGEGSAHPLGFGTDAEGIGPRAVAFGPSARLTVAAPNRIAVFDSDGTRLRMFTGLATHDPAAIGWRGDELIVADRELGVVIFGADGKERARLAGVRRAAGLAVRPDGGFFVSDEDAHAILRFGADNALEKRFGERGAFPGLLNAPHGLALSGDCLYVADELNHRIAAFSFDGVFRGQWGMHAVVPREGQGKIHYPVAIAIAPDGSAAVIAEPFERRAQWFTASDPQVAAAATMPPLSLTQSHFGAAVCADGDLLLLDEPETAGIFVFDLRGETPVHVTTFGGAGPGVDRMNRVVALGVDATTQRLAVIDQGSERLSIFALDRDRAAAFKMDPFMARFVRSWTTEAWSKAVAALAKRSSAPPLSPRAIAKGTNGWWIYDEGEGLIVRTDAKLAPVEVLTTGIVAAAGLAKTDKGFALAVPGQRVVVLLDDQGKVLERWRGPEGALFVRPTAVALGDAGALVVSDAGSDHVIVRDEKGTQSFSKRGISDGELWQPDGVCAFGGGRFVVVDRGNHRAQVFTNAGAWVMTFGLGRAYTTRREQGAS